MIRGAVLAMAVIAPAAWAPSARSQDAASDRPPTAPTRDVDVLYRAHAGGRDVEQRYRFAHSVEKVRIDTPSPGLYLIVDRGAKHMDMVSEGDRSVLELPYDPAHTMAGVPSDQALQRLGADTVAGVPCTEWRTPDKAGHDVTVCMTADGVMLRARAGATVLVQALSVGYGTLDPAVFAIPAGFKHGTGRGAAP